MKEDIRHNRQTWKHPLSLEVSYCGYCKQNHRHTSTWENGMRIFTAPGCSKFGSTSNATSFQWVTRRAFFEQLELPLQGVDLDAPKELTQ